MDIRLNGQSIDYSLENESTLSEILVKLNDWLLESGYIITKVGINNLEMIGYLEGLENTNSLESISTLEVQAQTLLEHRLEQLETVSTYLNQILNVSPDSEVLNGPEQIKEIVADFKSLARSVPQILDGPVTFQNSNDYGITSIQEKLLVMAENDDLKRKQIWAELTVQIGQFHQLLISRIKEYTHSNLELESASKVLKASIDLIPEMTTMLQTGKTEDALASIHRLMEITIKYIRILNLVEQIARLGKQLSEKIQKDLEEKSKALQDILNEIHEAFNNEDFVLLADVLEYEFPDSLTNLQEVGNTIAQEISRVKGTV